MTRTLATLGPAVLLSSLVIGQTAETKPSFELADVHVSPHSRNPYMRPPAVRNGLYQIRFATMVDLIRTAWGIDAERVLGGPNWLENDTFDVIAKAPAGTTVESAKPMLQALLAERFHLMLHNDTKPVPAWALKAGKHPQLKQSGGSGETGCNFKLPEPPGRGGPAPGPLVISYSCRNTTMEAFAQTLHTTLILGPQYLNDKVVVDQTNLKGAWDFDFKYTPKGMLGPDGPLPGAISLFDAIDKDLGLKLDPITSPLPVIVVDSVDEKPTANPSNIAESLRLPPRPTEFEVAEIKPTDPDSRGLMIRIQPGGRVNVTGATLKFLIQQAWQVTDDMIEGAPKWMETDRYDIVAKAGGPGPDIDIDELWTMLRALIVERFKLVTHMEERPMSAYTLTALKPKMKKSDPSTRTRYKEGPGADGKDPRDKNPILSRLVTCQNMTMAEFAAKLQDIASGYIHSPVLDATGLEGGYDFTLSFSAVGLTRGFGGGGRGGPESAPGALDAPAPSDPNGAITLFDAVEKQLGLKLQEQKRPVQVLVIDRADQKPLEN